MYLSMCVGGECVSKHVCLWCLWCVSKQVCWWCVSKPVCLWCVCTDVSMCLLQLSVAA